MTKVYGFRISYLATMNETSEVVVPLTIITAFDSAQCSSGSNLVDTSTTPCSWNHRCEARLLG